MMSMECTESMSLKRLLLESACNLPERDYEIHQEEASSTKGEEDSTTWAAEQFAMFHLSYS